MKCSDRPRLDELSEVEGRGLIINITSNRTAQAQYLRNANNLYEKGGSEVRHRGPQREVTSMQGTGGQRQLSWCFILDVVSDLLQRHAAPLLTPCKTQRDEDQSPDRRSDASKCARGNESAARHLLSRQKRSSRPFDQNTRLRS